MQSPQDQSEHSARRDPATAQHPDLEIGSAADMPVVQDGPIALGSGRRQASISAVPGVVEHEESEITSKIQVHVIARQMFEKHGLEAIAQATSDTEDAREWRHIEDAMKMMRGPHQS